MNVGRRILIGDTAVDFEALHQHLTEKGCEIRLCKRDGKEILSAISSEQPQIVILHALMPNGDALQVIRSSKEKGDFPAFIVVSPHESLFKEIVDIPNCSFILEPFDPEDLLSRVVDLLGPGEALPLEEKQPYTQHDLEVMATDMIHEIGVPAHVKGYYYLRYAILLLLRNASLIHTMTKGLYPMVGNHFGTKASCVERSMRHAIEIAWDRGDVEILNSYFGYTIHNNRGKPTNSEFISLISDRIRLETQGNIEEITL